MNKNYDKDIIFISVDPWQEERWARKQMLAYLLSEKFRNVIYYVEPGRSERKFPLLKRLKNNMYVINIPYLPNFLKNTKLSRLSVLLSNISTWFLLKILRIKNPIYVIYQPHNLAFAKKLSQYFGKSLLCYDLTDDWSEFPGNSEWRKNEIRQAEQMVLKEVDVVLAVSEKLLKKAKSYKAKSYYLPNATSFENFNKVNKELEISPEISGIPEPRIGYVGKITPWRIDFNLLKYVAVNRPNWNIVMIGPVHPDAKPIVEEMIELKNVFFLGPKNYYTLPYYIKGFEACILPHKVDALTASMDPIKLYDYMATGKPIVATSVTEAQKFKEVINIAESYEEFTKCLESILEGEILNESYDQQIKIAKYNSWENRTEQLAEILLEQNINTI